MTEQRNMGKLCLLLTKVFPNRKNQEGRIDAKWLAENMNVTVQTIYKWFKEDNLPRGRVLDLIDLADGRICIDDLVPFILK